MKTVRDACKLQPNALCVNVGDQIEKLDQMIDGTDGRAFFEKTFITDGMRSLLTKGIARLASKSQDSVFHLKQAMGGGKTHVMVGFGLLAKDPNLREALIGEIPHHAAFEKAKVAAFNGRNNPETYLWGELARQLGKEGEFKKYWESGAKAPDESAWLNLFKGDEPILILLDEMPPYFHYYSTQVLGQGTVADVVTRAFSNMLTAAQKKANVCIVVSDLTAAYDVGGKLIQKALNDATQELGRAEVGITPVNLESNEIYEILRCRLFASLPNKAEIAEVAEAYAKCLMEAAQAKTVERSAEALAEEIEATYPFHPRFKKLVALFKENEKFKQTRGIMELVSRLLKSVWERESNDVFLMGAQHFDLSIADVREKLADISEMRDVIACDLWESNQGAHAQIIDLDSGKDSASQTGALLLTASLSTGVNAIKGLNEQELLECLIDPMRPSSEFKVAFEELHKTAWYMHQTTEGRYYFDHVENLTKKLQGYAARAPENKVDELIRHRLIEMYQPTTREAYEKVLPLPEMDEADAALKSSRALLIISPDGKTPPQVVAEFFNAMSCKNNILVLTGDKSQFASVERAARHVYAVLKADKELPATHPQRKELDDKKTQYEQDFQATILTVFDKILFPSHQTGTDLLRSKALDTTYPSGETYHGERQVIKTLVTDPLKLYTDIKANFDALKAKAETLLFGGQDDVRRVDLLDKMKQKTQMPWLPPKGIDVLLQEAFQRGLWEDLGNGYVTKKPRPKRTSVLVSAQGDPDDEGKVRLKIETVNAGTAPRVHYAFDGPVSEKSPVLTDSILPTNALRTQFLAVDPSGKNQTGDPVTWENKIILRTDLDEVGRKVKLFAAPRGNIRYTLDGSEPRNGKQYTEPIAIGKGETKIYVFADADGLESKMIFTFPATGSDKINIVSEKPASVYAVRPKKLDSSAKTWDGISDAKEKGIEFENITLQIGSASRIITLTLGEIRVKASFIEEELTRLQDVLGDSNPAVVMGFKKAHFQTGHDLQQFIQKMGIELANDEVIQA